MAATNSSMNFKRTNHAEKVLKILQTEKFSDVVIIAEIDGTRVPAHRVPLSACSCYFSKLFSNELPESKEKEVMVRGVSGVVLQELVNYCYSGKISIRNENVYNLLAAASLLEINDLLKACKDFLSDGLHPSNDLELEQMYKQTEDFVNKHFMQMSQTKVFLKIDFQLLCRIITNDDLIVDSEMDKWQSCISWINFAPAQRQIYFDQLLKSIDLQLLPLNFISDHVRPLCKSSESKDLIIDTMVPRSHVGPQRHQQQRKPVIPSRVLSPAPTNTTKHLSQTQDSSNDVLLAIGEDIEEAKLTFRRYNTRTDEWTNLNVNIPYQWGAPCAVLGESLIIVGGYENDSKTGVVNSYDFKTKTMIRQQSLNTPRCYMGCAVLGDYLYIVGGNNGCNDLSSVERWDPKVGTWTFMASMGVERAGLGIAVLGKYLYAIGGRSSVYLKSVERYDPDANEWSNRAPMSTARYVPGVADGIGCLYAIGGIGTIDTTALVERYDPVADEWTKIFCISSARSEIGCALFENRLMIVGGFGTSWEPIVEEYDIRTTKLTLKKPLSGTCVWFRLVKVPNKYLSS